eukprot:scaffold12110_cov36-Prasinocladus_malaysianus.AAC.1
MMVQPKPFLRCSIWDTLPQQKRNQCNLKSCQRPCNHPIIRGNLNKTAWMVPRLQSRRVHIGPFSFNELALPSVSPASLSWYSSAPSFGMRRSTLFHTSRVPGMIAQRISCQDVYQPLQQHQPSGMTTKITPA